MQLTKQERDLMCLIGDGDYDYALPDDDETAAVLTNLYSRGLIGSDPARVGDFLYITRAGRKLLRANGQQVSATPAASTTRP